MKELPQPNGGFRWMQTAWGPALACSPLEPFADHLFTTRSWALGSAVSADDPAAWDEVAGAMGVDPAGLVRARQVHGRDVLVRQVDPALPDRPRSRDSQRSTHSDGSRDWRQLSAADILVSNDPSLVVAVQAADCVPLLLADRSTGAVAAAHAGWRGLAARVPEATVRVLAREFGSRPGDLVAAIGPSISAPRYEVGIDVRDRFVRGGFSPTHLARWFSDSHRARHWRFDGWQATCDQLEAAGVPADAIYRADLCTASHPDLFCSYRRDGSPAGRMAAVIRAGIP